MLHTAVITELDTQFSVKLELAKEGRRLLEHEGHS